MPENVPKKFCTAPWMEGHLYWDGQTRPCDHNQTSLGNWQQTSAGAVWKSAAYQEFRRKIAAGEFPNEQCQRCFANQNTSTLYKSVYPYVAILSERISRELPAFQPLRETLLKLFTDNDLRWSLWEEPLAKALHLLSVCPSQDASRLIHILQITRDFLTENLQPPVIAPIRQVRLINRCNARCVMCSGNFNGDIINGPGLDEKYVNASLEGTDGILNFASEASEFLLFKDWKKICEQLSSNGVPKLRLFTNGKLLIPETVRFLLDRKVLDVLHISVNAGAEATHETIQVNVKFQNLLTNIRYLFQYARTVQADFYLSFSFVIMKRNYHELPQFIRLIQELAGEHPQVKPHLYLAYLETNNEMPNYREFLLQEHHSLADPQMLRAALEEVAMISNKTGIPVALCESSLQQYLASGKPTPSLSLKPEDLTIAKKHFRSLKDSSLDWLTAESKTEFANFLATQVSSAH